MIYIYIYTCIFIHITHIVYQYVGVKTLIEMADTATRRFGPGLLLKMDIVGKSNRDHTPPRVRLTCNFCVPSSAIAHGHVERVDFPSKSWWIFPLRYVNVYHFG